MTPLYLNSPIPDLNQEHQFFLSPNYENSALSPQNSFFFNTEFANLRQDHQIVDYAAFEANPSSPIAFEAGVNENFMLHKKDEGEDHCNGEGSALKVKIVQKMMKSSENDRKPLKYTLRFQDQQPNYSESSSSQSGRVCSDCNTTTTPLWRSGPKGPKSLCNACGIRQRKARRAMAAAVGSGTTAETKSSKVHIIKDKKLRPGQCKILGNHVTQQPKISFKNFAFNFTNNNNSAALHPGFSQDVEQAAILLMELSSGFLQG